MKPILVLPALCAVALALAGCNSSAPPPQASAPQSARIAMTPPGFKLPDGAGCSGEVARYRAVIANDHDTGNVNDSVYTQIESEISGAATACSAGDSGRASALIHASKSRHGYPG